MHLNQPLKYTTLLHYSNIPNTHASSIDAKKYTLPQRIVLYILDNKHLFQNFRLKGETNWQILSKQVLKKQVLCRGALLYMLRFYYL